MIIDKSSYYPKSPLDDEPESAATAAGLQPEATEPDAATAAGLQPEATEPEANEPELPPTATETFISKVSHLLSWVLVPLLMPVYGVILAFGLSILVFIPDGTKLAFIAVALGFNMVIPAIIVAFLKKAGVVHDVGLNDRKERFIPYMVCIICLIGTALFFSHKNAPQWLVMFLLGGAAAGIVEVIINQWWKISVHSAGVAGIVAFLIHLLHSDFCMPQTFTWLLISIGAAGLLGAARIWLGRHTLGQVLAGYAVGFCAVYFLM